MEIKGEVLRVIGSEEGWLKGYVKEEGVEK